jgi:uncharacterized protein (DUF2141 family)
MKNMLLLLVCVAFLGISAKPAEMAATLQIVILDNLGNIQAGAIVTLYSSEKDYLEDKNPVSEKGVTNEKGKVTFKKLKPSVFYVKAEKGKMSNRGAGVKTQKLGSGKVNKMNIIISE